MSNQENTSPDKSVEKPPRRRGFFRSLLSHLMVAVFAVIAVSAYMHWQDVLKYTSEKVCSYDMLGQYASQPAKVPPIETKKPADDQSTKKQQQKSPAVETSQTDTSSKAKTEPPAQDLTPAWQAARKLFWTKDNEAALAAYEKLVQAYPDNAELRVELGNVLYKKGEIEKAAKTYFAAGEQFKRQKNDDQVAEIKKILEKIAPEKVKQFEALSE